MRPLAEVSLMSPTAVASTFSREQLAAVPELAESTAPRVDWQLVVALRRKASTLITTRIAAAAEAGTPGLSPTDRRLLGRSIVRAVVADHAARLGADGSALWPVETEHAYALAVEDAIFGYGRLQPLFEQPGAENIEILRSWELVDEELDLKGIHPELGEVSLRELIATWVVHDLTHIRQIATVMAKRYDQAVGPWKAYLSILN